MGVGGWGQCPNAKIVISQWHIVQVSQTWRQRQEAMIRLSSDKNDVENTTEKIKRKTYLVNLKQYCV